MYWDVVAVHSVAVNELAIKFQDGLMGTLVIDPTYCTGVFTALHDEQLVARAQVIDGVLVWPNGLDIAPDTLYREIKSHPAKRYILFSRLNCRPA
ncbi:DUF2442 domain-containing protein [Chromatium okenii]|uniref:DUF2442 domain-containing protein n=1 Tax=Chromatium okenii TaxID=61644 RepID=UPI0026EEFDF6|nr:DUF2442 domain-containing protein [Chromatium okenii]MBV5309153.1 DUF2442 domain-containing protein [Chromatium okenii]